MNNAITIHCMPVELFSLDTAVLRAATESPSVVAPQDWPARNQYRNRNLEQALKTGPIRAAIKATLDWCWAGVSPEQAQRDADVSGVLPPEALDD